jgi:hypothetical protein
MRHLDTAIALHNAALTRLEARTALDGPAIGRDPVDGNEYAWRLDDGDGHNRLARAARIHYAVKMELTGDTWEAWPMWWTWPGGAEEPKR